MSQKRKAKDRPLETGMHVRAAGWGDGILETIRPDGWHIVRRDIAEGHATLQLYEAYTDDKGKKKYRKTGTREYTAAGYAIRSGFKAHQLTIVETPRQHPPITALIDGVETINEVTAEKLMRDHMAAKAQYTPETLQRSLLHRDMACLTLNVLLTRYTAIAFHSKTLLSIASWREHRTLMAQLAIPALPAPQAQVLMLPAPTAPVIVLEQPEQEEERAA